MGRGILEDSLEEEVTACYREDKWFKMTTLGAHLSALRYKFTPHMGNV